MLETSLGAPVSNFNFYYEPLCWLWDFYLDFDFGLVTPTRDPIFWTQRKISTKKMLTQKIFWT